ncbi:3-hydroxy-5-methyl-1-naphthoate 3-O-methyltransferase [Abditibacteriota bacterium]|nr:3-hydroxy-5-methyl-1-naphthoate 3-O-methyltransferase [Abditibacteriota bacterium]
MDMKQQPTSSTTGEPVTPERILGMAWGFAPPLALEAAVKHRVFDVLDAGPQTLDQISASTGASKRGLAALLNVLVSINLLSKDGDTYGLTSESAAFLVSSKPGFQGGFLRHISTQLIPGWLDMNEVVGSGHPRTKVNTEEQGAEFFEEFVQSLFAMNYPAALALASHLELDQAKETVKVLDLAAGSGVWGIGLAKASPFVHATGLDWARIVPIIRRNAEQHGLGDRFDYIEGDLLEVPFGEGYNVVTLGHILHSEGEERSRALLKKVFDALAPGGTIAIAEFLVNNDRCGPPSGTIFAMNMLLHTQQGNTYSFEEIASWLDEIGFENARQLPAPAPSPLILATKPL